ncbi:MAG: DUF92 domain-containing protein [Candidatus Heimdallarchaeota archaeon]
MFGEISFSRFGLSIALNGTGVLLAYLKNHLKFPTGTLAAYLIGFILFIFNPFAWLFLAAFFISSSLLTRFRAQAKLEVQDKFEKGGQRDAAQVFTNSLPPVFYVILLAFFSPTNPLSPLFVAIATYFASVNADTFSTEIGTLAKSLPRWILDPRRTIEKGTSGGVTILGSLAGAFGSLEIALLYLTGVYLISSSSRLYSDIVIVTFFVFLGGILGNSIDSLLGASIQGFYYCPYCQIGTEKRIHLKCGGTITCLIRGWKIISNDWVNLLSPTIASLLFGAIFYYLI